MIARAAEIGARLTVDSAPGRGTRIRLRFRTPGA
jgi:signal transduction histidine kinase